MLYRFARFVVHVQALVHSMVHVLVFWVCCCVFVQMFGFERFVLLCFVCKGEGFGLG